MTQEFRGDGHTAADDSAGDFCVSTGSEFVSQGNFRVEMGMEIQGEGKVRGTNEHSAKRTTL